MPDQQRSPLADYLAELEWSPERLARQLNAVYGPGTAGATTPYAWLLGRVPRGRLPYRVAELLSARLGRTVTVGDLWPRLCPVGPAPSAADQGGAVPSLPPGAAVVMGLSSLPARSPAGEIDLANLAAAWLLNPAPRAPVGGGPLPVDEEVLACLRGRAKVLLGMNVSAGGGSTVALLDHEVAFASRLIAHGRYDAEAGTALCRAFATTALYTGYAALDADCAARTDCLSPTAYWTLGLHAAQAASDTATGACLVAGMALEVGLLGRSDLALQLLRSAQVALLPLPRGGAHITVASYEARALAAAGEPGAALAALDSLRALLPETDDWKDGEHHCAAAFIHRAVSRSLLRLGHVQSAVDYLETALARPGTRYAHGSHGTELLMVLARCRLAQRDVDAAADLVHRAVQPERPRNSQLLRRHAVRLREGLHQFRAAPVAKDAYDLLHTYLGPGRADPGLRPFAI